MQCSAGHFFPTGMHVTQYPGDFWVWSDMVTDDWVGTAGNVACCVNAKDASAC